MGYGMWGSLCAGRYSEDGEQCEAKSEEKREGKQGAAMMKEKEKKESEQKQPYAASDPSDHIRLKRNASRAQHVQFPAAPWPTMSPQQPGAISSTDHCPLCIPLLPGRDHHRSHAASAGSRYERAHRSLCKCHRRQHARIGPSTLTWD